MMLSINETFDLISNQPLPIDYKQFSCVYNIKTWLLIHFIIKYIIETFILVTIMHLLFEIAIFICNDYCHGILYALSSSWLVLDSSNRFSLMISVLKKEMKLIFVYVFITFLYTWFQFVNSNYTISYFNFLR